MSSIAAGLHPHRLLDRAEQAGVLALYGWLVARLWPADFSAAHWSSILILVSEGLVVALLLLRRPTEHISRRLADWMIAAAGTFLALFVAPGGAPIHSGLGVAMMMAGLAVHVGAKLSLFRSFGLVAANRGVKTGGLYRFVRHPMYAGYVLAHAGYLMAGWSWWNLMIYLSVWTLLIARIAAEEKVLVQDPLYAGYAQKVRWRLAPLVY